jgi:stage V sporulation protein B
MKNTFILFAAMGISKLIGATLRIPLTNILGGLGMGYFSTAHSLFGPVFAVTSAALPTVIMRMVARSAPSGKFADLKHIRRAGLSVAVGLGLTGTVIILLIAAPFSSYVAASPNSLPALLIIAPALFFSSVSAVYRGYYEGLSNMMPTAISQIVEAVAKSVFGILLAVALLPHGIHLAAAGAIAGITIAEFFGMVFLLIRSRFREIEVKTNESAKPIVKTIFKESMPITLAALSLNLNPLIDLLTIPSIIDTQKLIHSGNFIYGSYTGIAIPIFAIATTLTAMIGRSAFPEITAAYENQDNRRLTRALKILFKGTFIVGFPLCIGLTALAHPILSVLYPARPAEVYVSTLPLEVLGLGGISLILAGTLFGIFIAIGRVDLQIKLMLAGATIKLVGNLVLIRIESLNVTGAAISTVICYTFISIVGLYLLKRILPERLPLVRFTVAPLIFALKCGTTAYICYYYLFTPERFGYPDHTFTGSTLNLAMSIAAGALVYLIPTMITDRKYIRTFLPARNNST